MTGLIGIDWGTSRRRAFRFDDDGKVAERREDAHGIMAVADGGFPVACAGLVGDWMAEAPAAPVLLSGMVGSRQGWLEAPYVDCPADLDSLARGLTFLPAPDGVRMAIVPGLADHDADGVPDVMRGEEAEIVGALPDQDDPAERSDMPVLVVLPGTHSKWALVRGGRVERFATFMTGEVYGVLRQHSILGRLMAGSAPDAEAFGKGVARGHAAGAGLLKLLFSVRTEGLFGRIDEAALADYLSGLLIGAEIAGAASLFPEAAEGEALLVGDPALSERYAAALAQTGRRGRTAPPDGAARGLWRIARQAWMT